MGPCHLKSKERDDDIFEKFSNEKFRFSKKIFPQFTGNQDPKCQKKINFHFIIMYFKPLFFKKRKVQI